VGVKLLIAKIGDAADSSHPSRIYGLAVRAAFISFFDAPNAASNLLNQLRGIFPKCRRYSYPSLVAFFALQLEIYYWSLLELIAFSAVPLILGQASWTDSEGSIELGFTEPTNSFRL